MTDFNREDRALYVLLALVGAVLLTATALARGAADTGATLGLACTALAGCGMVSQLRAARRTRLPGAHVRRG